MIDVHVHYRGSGKLAGDFTGRPCESLDRGEAGKPVGRYEGHQPPDKAEATRRRGAGLATRRRICPRGRRLPDRARPRQAGRPHSRGGRSMGQAHRTRPPLSSNVNRTPHYRREIHASRRMKDKGAYGLMGSGLSNEHDHTALPLKAGRGQGILACGERRNAIHSDHHRRQGTDLSVIERTIRNAIEKAIRRAKRKNGNGNGHQTTQAANDHRGHTGRRSTMIYQTLQEGTRARPGTGWKSSISV